MKEGFSKPVYWSLILLFLVAVMAMVFWFWLSIRDLWVYKRELVAGRFDDRDVLRITTAVYVSVAVPSGPLWVHYKRIDSFGSPLELLFGVVFVLNAALATICFIPALF